MRARHTARHHNVFKMQTLAMTHYDEQHLHALRSSQREHH
jgi:hypothetical protein